MKYSFIYLKFRAGLVQSFISLQELNDENGEVLEAVRVNCDRHRLHSGGTEAQQLNLVGNTICQTPAIVTDFLNMSK